MNRHLLSSPEGSTYSMLTVCGVVFHATGILLRGTVRFGLSMRGMSLTPGGYGRGRLLDRFSKDEPDSLAARPTAIAA
jgi:hypothetical protein